MSTLARDGYGIDPIEIGRPIIERPFRLNGDSASLIIKRRYKQIAEYFTPLALKTPDVQYPTAYLIAETDPEPTATGLVDFIRTYAHIPAQQVVPSSMFITKPPISSFAAPNGTLLDRTIGALGGTVYLYGSTAFAAGGSFAVVPGRSSLTYPTGGTFTLSFGANTTGALAYNASDATITAALNGLASVSAAGVTFSVATALYVGAPITESCGPTLIVSIASGTTTQPVTMNAASLTPSTCTSAFTKTNAYTSGGQPVQLIVIMSRVNIPAHGFTAGENLIARWFEGENRWILLPPSQWLIVDANNIALSDAYNFNTVYDQFGQAGGISYADGTVNTRIKRVTDFYLPGVSEGIASVDDIPLPVNQGTPAALIGAILAGATSINYEVGELKQWRDGPILARTITTLNASTL